MTAADKNPITLPSGNNPFDAIYDPVFNIVYVTTGQGTVEEINTTTNAVITTIPIDDELSGIAVDNDTGQLFIASRTDGVLFSYDPQNDGIELPGYPDGIPWGVVYNHADGYIFVSDYAVGKVSIIDPASNSIIKNVNVGTRPTAMSVDPNTGFVYVANAGSGTVSIISPTTLGIVGTITLPGGDLAAPYGLAVDPIRNPADKVLLFVSDNSQNNVYIYNVTGTKPAKDVRMQTLNFPPGSGPSGVEADCSNNSVWVLENGLSEAAVLGMCYTTDQNYEFNAVDTLNTGAAPYYMAFDPVHHEMYVTNQGTDTVSVFSADALQSSVNALGCPMGIADYGTSGGVKQTGYTAKSIYSWNNFTSLNIGTSSDATANQVLDIQLNMVDYGVAEHTNTGIYWVQNTLDIKQTGTGTYGLDVVDNIWNWTGSATTMSNKTGNLVYNLPGKCNPDYTTYYACSQGDVSSGNYIATLTLPFQIKLTVQTGVVTSGKYKGNSTVAFSYSIYQGYTLVKSEKYDVVDFLSTIKSSPGFKIGGTNPRGHMNDVENVFTGESSSANVYVNAITANMQVYYQPKSGGSFVPLQHVWTSGGETAETVVNVHMSYDPDTNSFVASSGTINPEIELT